MLGRRADELMRAAYAQGWWAVQSGRAARACPGRRFGLSRIAGLKNRCTVTSEGAMTRRSARKAKGDGHLRRGEILEAAERIFVAEGYEGATIRRIAEEVGVSSTALYLHFPDKQAILL